MTHRYELLQRGFHDGALRERGEVVTLREDERPGEHMRLYVPPAPIKPIVVDALPKAPAMGITRGAEAFDPPAAVAAPIVVLPPPIVIPQPTGPGYLIFDTETNSLKDPRLASIAMIFADRDLNTEYEYHRLIRPVGWEMEAEAGKVNGLTMAELERSGNNLIEPIIVFELALSWGRTIVSHNLAFDLRVMRGEMRREWRGSAMVACKGLCTMHAARRMVGTGKLSGAYEILMSQPFKNAHEAMADARGCQAVLRKLRERGLDMLAETKEQSPSESAQ
jgi:DNA polymerase III subunit epsilon